MYVDRTSARARTRTEFDDDTNNKQQRRYHTFYVPIGIGTESVAPDANKHIMSVLGRFFFRLLGFHSSTNTEDDESNPLLSPDMRLSLLSNLGTSYNVLNIGIALQIMDRIYDDGNSYNECGKELCSSSLIAGMITGQLLGGSIGDWLGRHQAMSFVMMLQVLSSIGSSIFTISRPFSSSEFTIYHMLAIWRFFLGIGCGGVYPLAAILTVESTSTRTPEYRAKLVAFTFSMQGVGYLAVPLMSLALTTIFGETSDYSWRILIGLGCVPGVILLCNRIRRHFLRSYQASLPVIENILEREVIEEPLIEKEMSSSTLFSTDDEASVLPFDDIEGIEERTDIDNADELLLQKSSILNFIRNEKNLIRKLCGTAGSWFLFDVLFYGNALFQQVVLSEAFGDSETLTKTIYDQIIIAIIALPGYFVSVIAVGKLSPKFIQVQGFVIMAILYIVIGIFFDGLKKLRFLLITLYGLTFFFANFGPNATTFMLPSITFSPNCRSTLNGISAACGKLGALIGAVSFAPISESLGDSSVMIICGSISIVGLCLTLFCVQELNAPLNGSDSEHSGQEKERGRRRKASNLAYGPLRNGEVGKTFRGSEFWRRRNQSIPSFLDYDD